MNNFRFAFLLLLIAAWACTKKEIRTIAVPSITGVNKTTAHVGDTLTITGTGFSTVAADNIAAISSASLTVIQASATQLVAVVPAAAQSGQLTVAFPGGQPAVYSQKILIVGTIQPFINAITPSVAYAGDTIVIHGGSFGTPANTNDIVLTGIAFTILNATDSVIRAVVPEMGHSGPLTVTTDGVTSLPFRMTVQRPDPLADGRLYWPTGGYNTNGSPFTTVYKGADSVVGFPYGTIAYQNNTDNALASDNLPWSAGPMDPLQSDALGNVYNIYVVLQNGYYPTPEYKLMRLAPQADGTLTNSILLDHDFSDMGSTNFYPNPADSTNVYALPNTPGQLSIDGNTIYIKLGVTNSYYKADLSASSPSFTTVMGVVPDSMSYGPQFGTNYVFYKTLAAQDVNSLPTASQVKYMQRGGSTAQTILLPAGESVMTTLADNRHGDNILIFTRQTATPYATKIYKFNAATQELQNLYGPNNWPDGINNDMYTQYTSGVLWAGPHIYYTSSIHHNLYPSYSGVYVLNDDGSSTRSLNVYPRLEPAQSTSAYGTFNLFMLKK